MGDNTYVRPYLSRFPSLEIDNVQTQAPRTTQSEKEGMGVMSGSDVSQASGRARDYGLMRL